MRAVDPACAVRHGGRENQHVAITGRRSTHVDKASIGRPPGPQSGRYVTFVLRAWVPDHPADEPHIQVIRVNTGSAGSSGVGERWSRICVASCRGCQSRHISRCDAP